MVRIIRNSWGPLWGVDGHIYMKRGVNMCGVEENGGASATATSSSAPNPPVAPAYPLCPFSGSSPVCGCAPPSGSSTPSDSFPCTCPAGTDCFKPFSGCSYCGRPSCASFMQAGESICSCTTGDLPDGSVPVPCACGHQDCNAGASSCKFCARDVSASASGQGRAGFGASGLV